MIHFIRLTRPVNLLVIVLTMCVVHALFLNYTLVKSKTAAFLDPYFILLVGSTVLIAAAGNIINDYFDVKIDRINKPDKLIVDRFIVKRKAILFHTLLNGAAIGMAMVILIGRHDFWPLVFHFATTSALWMYSGVLKRKFLSGNITIGVLTAMVPMLVYLYDKNLYGYMASQTEHEIAFRVMAYFALFAFCTTLIREIQKDFADMKGDRMYGCQTVPLYMGIKKGRMILLGLFFVTIVLFIVLYFMFAKQTTLNSIFFGVITLLMLVSFMQTLMAVKRPAWQNAALTMKLVMVAAILFFAVKVYAQQS
ncbi:MAG TPA: geranylgeranylglycerol-phosphate geranylgeranyltransferase [Flavobacteriales bacterium]|nr:geranylgeranylglycerol-phosphate geranylgeranyltransferase [Flavobacteriales bacterium]